MKRTRTERSKLIACWLIAATLHAAPARAQTEADRVAARAFFDQGLSLAKGGDYAAALAEFQRAYAAVPHHGVLYNIAQAQLALGRNEEALRTFQRYLAEGGSAVEPHRQAEVEALIAKLQAETEPGASTAKPLEMPPPSAAPVPLPGQLTAAPPAATPVASARKEPQNSRQGSPDPAKPRRVVAYVLGGASAVLAGAALGHYVWNRSRYRQWQTARESYERHPSEYQRVTTNDLAESVSRASVVTVALFVGASVTLSSSVVLFVTSQPSAERSAQPVDGIVGLRGTF